jgi:hypothetical protein
MGKNLYVSLQEMSVKVGSCLSQRIDCFLQGQRRRDYPQAEVIIFQPDLEIRNQNVEQILFRLVEVTEVCAPGDVAYDADAGLS